MEREGDEAVFLNRRLRRTAAGFSVTSDGRIPASLVKELGLETATAVDSPMVKPVGQQQLALHLLD